MKITKIIFCSLLAFGCSNVSSSSVEGVLTETKTKYKAPMVCPELTTKVCNGPDKRSVDKYPRHYCKCLNRRDVQRALEMMSTGN
tara:strand:+ start:2546 stop:2800 length:255 start_codon:yes stop_codon:yes gene_type:complete